MFADFSEPVFRVPEITLATVHDAVPKAAFGRMNRLADLVRRVELAAKQQQPTLLKLIECPRVSL